VNSDDAVSWATFGLVS